MTHSLFIADVHLQPNSRHPINLAFKHFLRSEALKAKQLYILGDLFEMWVGDDIGLSQYQEEIAAIKQLTDQGTEVFILYGNRDFLMRQRFWQATGAHYLAQPECIVVEGQDFIVLHGDQLCTDDIDYQRMRRLLRHPLTSFLFLLLPAKKRLQIGEKMRANSLKHNQNKAENIMDANEKAIIQAFQRYPTVQHMIHGHTHRPNHHLHSFNNHIRHRWVLGDWRMTAHQVTFQALKISPNTSPHFFSCQFDIQNLKDSISLEFPLKPIL